MYADAPSRSPLAAWLVISLLIHIAIMLPAFTAAMRGSTSTRIAQANFEPESIDKPTMPEQLRIGVEKSDASTMTWVGYEEYEEHLAELGAVEQAAFDREQPSPAQPLVEAPSQATPVEPLEQPTEIVEPATADDAPPAERATAPASSAARSLAVNPMEFMSAMNELVAVIASQIAEQQIARKPGPGESDDSEDAEEQSQTLAKAKEKAVPAIPPPAEVDPSKPTVDPADRESDATSIVDVPLDDLKLGKPLAAKGLELKPARPQFTTLQLVTLAPCCNPLTRMDFTSDGRPLRAEVIESSGHALIDEAVEASLYRWRASGGDLDKLTGEQTISVEIRIILVAK